LFDSALWLESAILSKANAKAKARWDIAGHEIRHRQQVARDVS
jgi:hypothetical protein